MNNFEKNFRFERPEDEVIKNIFPTEGRSGFCKKVKEVFEWSQKGGPKRGTFLFIKGIVGNIKLKPEESLILKREINREIRRIEKDSESSINQRIRMKSKETNDWYKEISQKAEEDLTKELKRSGGIDPNEL